tara:strand:- start:31 stop:327 length:297 start_codon:yes stop_codon:yes gene_type:complete
MKTFKELIDDLVEITVGQRVKKTSAEKMKQKQEYRKTKQKKKQYMKKYRRSSGAKMLQKKGERMASRGLTATGKQKTVAGGAGAAQRAKEKKQDLQKR